MDTKMSARFILLNMGVTVLTVLVIAAALLTGGRALAQAGDPPDGPAQAPAGEQAAPSADSGEGLTLQDVPAVEFNTGDGSAPSEGGSRFGPDNGPDALSLPYNPLASLSYYRLLGIHAIPRNSTAAFAYDSKGCFHQTNALAGRYVAPVLLPDNAIIKYLRIYYNDTSAASDLDAWLTRYEPGVDNFDLATTSSSGSGGFGSSLSEQITQTVNTNLYTYDVNVGFPSAVTTNAIQFCGIRVAYYAPTFGAAALPAISKNAP